LRALRAVARNEALAEAVGISPTAVRASAFVFAGVFGGLAGAFSAAELQTAQRSIWGIFPSIYIVAYGVVGGTRSVFGALLGTTVVMGISSELASVGSLSSNSVDPILSGAGLILVVLALPEGLVSIANRVVRVRRLSWRVAKGHEC
jgi:branched-chain amino acid transport system permease protein